MARPLWDWKHLPEETHTDFKAAGSPLGWALVYEAKSSLEGESRGGMVAAGSAAGQEGWRAKRQGLWEDGEWGAREIDGQGRNETGG